MNFNIPKFYWFVVYCLYQIKSILLHLKQQSVAFNLIYWILHNYAVHRSDGFSLDKCGFFTRQLHLNWGYISWIGGYSWI